MVKEFEEELDREKETLSVDHNSGQVKDPISNRWVGEGREKRGLVVGKIGDGDGDGWGWKNNKVIRSREDGRKGQRGGSGMQVYIVI